MSQMSTSAETDFLRKIETRDAVVCVIGLGYVGLPIAVAFAEAGFRTIGVDVNASRVDAVNSGDSYIQDISSETLGRLTSSADRSQGDDLADKTGELTATADFEVLAQADAIIVCVPTPLSKTKDPDVSYIVSAADEIAARLRKGTLIVLESTTYPGTTEEIILPRLEQAESPDSTGGKWQAGVDFFLAFSPERIDPGRTDWTVTNTPKVMGGVTLECRNSAKALYQCALKCIVPVSSPGTAEMVKLLENTFRATNIALINEFAIMCDRLDIDIWEVIDAAKTKPFGYMPFYPGPGLGGHCIPIDPHYLAWKLKTLDYDARFIELAEEINFGMPEYVVGKVSEYLKQDGTDLKGSDILVLGVAYKSDVSDTRESPGLDLIQLLKGKGANVVYNDPHVPNLLLSGVIQDDQMESVELTEDLLRSVDCAIICTAHSAYDWGWMLEHSRLLMDTRNATKGLNAVNGRLEKL